MYTIRAYNNNDDNNSNLEKEKKHPMLGVSSTEISISYFFPLLFSGKMECVKSTRSSASRTRSTCLEVELATPSVVCLATSSSDFVLGIVSGTNGTHRRVSQTVRETLCIVFHSFILFFYVIIYSIIKCSLYGSVSSLHKYALQESLVLHNTITGIIILFFLNKKK